MALPAEKGRYTFADVLAWDGNERTEIIDGEPVMMAPPTTAHQLISMELSRQLWKLPGREEVPRYPGPLCRPAL